MPAGNESLAGGKVRFGAARLILVCGDTAARQPALTWCTPSCQEKAHGTRSSETEVAFISRIPTGTTKSKSKGDLSWDAEEESWHLRSALCFMTRGLGTAVAVTTETSRRSGELTARGNFDASLLPRTSGSFLRLYSEGSERRHGTLKALDFWITREMLQELRRKPPGAGSHGQGPVEA